MMRAVFERACPNCGGRIDSERLMLAAPCRSCLNIPDDDLRRLLREGLLEYRRKVAELLSTNGRLVRYAEIKEFEERVAAFREMAKGVLGADLWDAQVNWACKALAGKSFAITAPTGLGKTTFGLLCALHKAVEGGKCYVVVPTSILVEQAKRRIDEYASRISANIKTVCYYADLHGRDREESKRAIDGGDFDVLITTSQFLLRYFEILRKVKFDFIFVDDVDALLKASRNIENVLQLLGFTPSVIEVALDVIKAKRRLASRGWRQEEVGEYFRVIKEGQEEVGKFKSDNKVGMLIVSTATGKPRGVRVKLFKELLGFEVGSKVEQIRNVADLYLPLHGDMETLVSELVTRLGGGGLVFVPMDMGIEFAEQLAERLRANGIAADVFYSGEKRGLQGFISKEVEVLIGVANYYGLLVRGIDLPQRIRYALFAGVPRVKLSLAVEEASPIRVLQLLIELRDVLEGDERRRAEAMIARLSREMDVLQILIKKVEGLTARQKLVLRRFEEVKTFVSNLLQREDVRRRLEGNPYISIKEVEGKLYIVIPDCPTYIQASGRTSRVFAGGVSKGISVVIVDDEKVFSGLTRKTKWMVEEIDWRPLKEVDLDSLISEVDRDRKLIEDVISGKATAKTPELVKSALLVVESPNKARTIANFFGRPARRVINGIQTYEVSTGKYVLSIAASGGHVYDLVTQKGFHGVEISDGGFVPVYSSIKRCRECKGQFTDDLESCPVCGSKEIEDAAARISSFKDLAREVSVVLIGTDPDVEGEKIGWDVSVVLRPYSRDIKRIEFHEVTRRAILKALESPREIDERMVEAQTVRRVEDRWLGFELSRRLWGAFNNNRLSAGRVQTPVLGWVIERRREWERSWSWVYIVTLENGVKVVMDNVPPEVDPESFKARVLKGGAYIKDLKRVEEQLNPPPPYTTDTMLRDASLKFKLGATETMSLAQDLFELGFITYHRTDSARVSDVGMGIAKSYIAEALGERLFKARAWAAEGAHECVRPTKPMDSSRLLELIREGVIKPAKRLTPDHLKLYNMIFNRFIASQMAPARAVKQRFVIEVDGIKKELEGYVKVVEEGYTKVMPIKLMEEVSEGPMKVRSVTSTRRPAVRLYTQGDLVQLMKERGIGRPSTYAKILDVLRRRWYVVETERGELIPTSRGAKVYEYLRGKYGDIVSEERTRLIEKVMDGVEVGKVDHQQALRELYEEIAKLP